MKSKYLQVDGLKIHYLGGGDRRKPTLLLIHSWPFSSIIFEDIIPYLEKDYHIVTPDLPGFGHSEEMNHVHNFTNYVYFLNKFAKTLKLRRFSIFGVPFGAILSVYYALKYPKKIKKVIVNGLPFHYSRILKRPSRFLILKLLRKAKTAKLLLQVINKSRFNKKLYLYHNPCMKKYLTKEKMDKVYEEYCLYREVAARESLISLLNFDLKDKIKKISSPVLVIGGTKDNLAKLSITREIISFFPNANLVNIQNADHCCISEEPEKMSKLIKKFLRKN